MLRSNPFYETFHFGEVDGNIVNVPFSQLQRPYHAVVGGGECAPWAGNGSGKGSKDPRAKVFLTMVEWVKIGIREGYLLWFTLENTANMMSTAPGRKCVADVLKDSQDTAKGTFLLDAPVVKGLESLMVQNRDRVLLRGAAKRVVPGWEKLPQALNFTVMTYGNQHKHEFSDFLDAAIPNANRALYTQNQRDNLAQIEAIIMSGELEIPPGTKAILIQLCRKASGT